MSTQHIAGQLEVICGRCEGSGETTYLSDGSPDAYDVACNCPRCGGSGARRIELNETELRAQFEALAHDSYGFKRSRKGTYQNPAVARDWKWFQLGYAAFIAKATGEAP